MLDGFGWELLIKKIGKKEKKICGYNSYPKNKKVFKSFLECILYLQNKMIIKVR